jgi:hypothetical protein
MYSRKSFIFYSLTVISSVFLLVGDATNTTKTSRLLATNPDSTLFRTLVQYVDTAGLQFDSPENLRQLQIDPRMIDSAYQHSTKLKKKHLQTLNNKQVSHHKSILAKFDIPPTNVISDLECVFSQGFPPPPPADSQKVTQTGNKFPDRCEDMGFFLTVIFGQPQLVASKNCDISNQDSNARCFAVRANEYTSYSIFTFIIYLKKEEGEWEIIRKKRLGGAYS